MKWTKLERNKSQILDYYIARLLKLFVTKEPTTGWSMQVYLAPFKSPFPQQMIQCLFICLIYIECLKVLRGACIATFSNLCFKGNEFAHIHKQAENEYNLILL